MHPIQFFQLIHSEEVRGKAKPPAYPEACSMPQNPCSQETRTGVLWQTEIDEYQESLFFTLQKKIG